MKRLLMLSLSLFLLVACSDGIDRSKPVFHIENVGAVLFYTPTIREGIEVPEEDLSEITEWLGSFTIGKKAGEILIPGSNSISFRIEYCDGTTVENGLSTIEVNGKRYYMNSGTAPESYFELIDP